MHIVNKAQLAEILGYTERTLTEWQEEGMPIARRAEQRGQAHEYDAAGVVAWLVERTERKARADNPKDQLYRSQVKLNELKIGEMENRLVDAIEVERQFTNMVLEVRRDLLQLADRVAGELQADPGVEEKRERLRREVLEALKGFAGREHGQDQA